MYIYVAAYIIVSKLPSIFQYASEEELVTKISTVYTGGDQYPSFLRLNIFNNKAHLPWVNVDNVLLNFTHLHGRCIIAYTDSEAKPNTETWSKCPISSNELLPASNANTNLIISASSMKFRHSHILWVRVMTHGQSLLMSKAFTKSRSEKLSLEALKHMRYWTRVECVQNIPRKGIQLSKNNDNSRWQVCF